MLFVLLDKNPFALLLIVELKILKPSYFFGQKFVYMLVL